MDKEYGYASVWVCQEPMCGFIGFYKPEADLALISTMQTRRCPNCGAGYPNYMVKPEDLAKIEIDKNPNAPRIIMPNEEMP